MRSREFWWTCAVVSFVGHAQSWVLMDIFSGPSSRQLGPPSILVRPWSAPGRLSIGQHLTGGSRWCNSCYRCLCSNLHHVSVAEAAIRRLVSVADSCTEVVKLNSTLFRFSRFNHAHLSKINQKSRQAVMLWRKNFHYLIIPVRFEGHIPAHSGTPMHIVHRRAVLNTVPYYYASRGFLTTRKSSLTAFGTM